MGSKLRVLMDEVLQTHDSWHMGHECRIASWTQRAYLLAFLQPFSVCTAWLQLLGLLWACSNPHFLSTRHRYPGRNTSTADRCRIDVGCTSPIVLTAYRASLSLSRAGLQQGALLDLVLWDWPALRTSPLLGSWMRPSASQLRSSLAFGYAAGQTVRIQKNWGRMNSTRVRSKESGVKSRKLVLGDPFWPTITLLCTKLQTHAKFPKISQF